MNRLLSIAALAGILTLSGCGGGDKIDAGKTEKEIAEGVEQQSEVTGVEISCPADVERGKGDTFECDLEADKGVKAKVEVVQQDDDGNVRWQVVSAEARQP